MRVSDPSVFRRRVPGCRFELGIRVPQRREIRSPRPGVEVLEEPVVALLFLDFRGLALGIVQVAEDDRVRRADGLAGGRDLTVADRAIFTLGVDPGLIDALDA